MLEREFKYYKDHQKELLLKYQGRVVVIIGETVIGDYGSEIEAIEATKKDHPLGTFLVQKCEPGKDSYSMTFHSRVALSR